MNYNFLTISDQGEFRKSNQDSFYANSVSTKLGKAFLGIVCDGMGGLSHGEVASATVISSFSEWFEHEFRYIMPGDGFEDAVASQWQGLITEANNGLRALAAESSQSMGTTISALLLVGDKFYIAQVGDSRVYMGGEGFFAPVTKDHSYVMEQADKGLMTYEEARLSSKKNVLTRCIGVLEQVQADLYTGDVVAGDYFLICSDGYCSSLTPQEVYSMSGCVAGNPPKNKAALEAAVAHKRSLGEKDNITAVTVAVTK